MIYLSDDYIEKYIDTLSYLINRAVEEGYSFDYIEKHIAYSKMVNEMENSNITTIAFSSVEKIYKEIFPYKDNTGFINNVYNKYGWISNAYIDLFLKLNITFETLFITLPIEYMVSIYPLYHEMSFSQVEELLKERTPYSYLDNIMRNRGVSTNDLSSKTGIPFSTINALRYHKRDIAKLESAQLLKISRLLSVKMESLLPDIYLIKH